jgi:Bacterial regulatory helix-turn-helix protein, lysR family
MTTQRNKDGKFEPIAHRLRSKLEVNTGFGSLLGDTRVKPLEAIEAHGSISQAAKAGPVSYNAARNAIDAMNNLADQPLVVRSIGGKSVCARRHPRQHSQPRPSLRRPGLCGIQGRRGHPLADRLKGITL